MLDRELDSIVVKSLLNDYYRAPGVDNWTIIELQGTLETKEDVSLEGKAIGDLHFDGKVGKLNRTTVFSNGIDNQHSSKLY